MSRQPKIKAIIFDCFGVFYIDPTKQFLDIAAGRKPDIHALLEDLDNQTDYGLISREEYAAQVASLIDLPLEEVRYKLLEGSVLNETLLQYAQTLRPRYKVGLLSNISPGTMDNFFTQKDRAKYFDAVITSGEVGMIKPHPEIFVFACERLGVDTSEALMIDDSPANCAGARVAGLQAILYEDTATTMQTLTKLLK